MGTPWPENQCPHRKRKIAKLIKDQARDTAAQLQILSEKPTGDHDGLEKLLEKRFTSFTESLSHVSLCRCKDCECEVTQISNRVGSPISDQRSVDSGKGKRPAAEDRRGSNERNFRGSNERSVPSKTISDSGSHSRRISSETISTQSTSSSPSSAASGRKEGLVAQMGMIRCTAEASAISTQNTNSSPSSAASGRKECRVARVGMIRSTAEASAISTQNTSSRPSSAASGRKECWEESNELVELKKLSCDFESLQLEGSFKIENSKFWILKHLDISKCYYLDHMPKEISNLLQLEVLKGFVVGNSIEKEKDSCTLEHLAKLTKLRKLSVYTKREDFPVISDLRDLKRLKRLHKLKIEWGGVSVHKSENITKVDYSSEEMAAVESTKQENHGHADTEIAVNVGNKRESNTNPTNATESGAKLSTSSQCNFLSTVELSDLFVALSLRPVENDASPELPPQLEELHLKCLPRTSAPDWLRASKRNKIKKLHIEGGPLSDLGQLALQEKSEWQVEKLRLKFLKGLEMNWRDLKKLFTKLIYFEKVGCPKLQFSPCDEQGVSMKKPNKFF